MRCGLAGLAQDFLQNLGGNFTAATGAMTVLGETYGITHDGIGELAERVGIEPTSARSRTDNGFEDRGGHQAPSTLQIVIRPRVAGHKAKDFFLQSADGLQHRFGFGKLSRCPLGIYQLIICCDFKHTA